MKDYNDLDNRIFRNPGSGNEDHDDSNDPLKDARLPSEDEYRDIGRSLANPYQPLEGKTPQEGSNRRRLS